MKTLLRHVMSRSSFMLCTMKSTVPICKYEDHWKFEAFMPVSVV